MEAACQALQWTRSPRRGRRAVMSSLLPFLFSPHPPRTEDRRLSSATSALAGPEFKSEHLSQVLPESQSGIFHDHKRVPGNVGFPKSLLL